VRRACDDAPLSVPSCWRPGNVVCPQRSPGTCSPAPRPSPSAENWVRFSCSIPPLFVLSHSMPTINTTGKLASFWRFSLTTDSLPSDSLTTGHCSFAPRRHPPTSGVRPCADPPPLATACHRQPICQRPNGVQSRRTTPLYSVCHRTRRFPRKNQSVSPHSLPPAVDHSLAAGGAQRQSLQARLPDGHQPQCPFSACALPDFPEFAQAVRYGVPGTPRTRILSVDVFGSLIGTSPTSRLDQP
jgi:hypothetical protein